MSLPLCSPDKIECVRNLETKNDDCLPQCSGLWVISYNQEKSLKLPNTNKGKILWKNISCKIVVFM